MAVKGFDVTRAAIALEPEPTDQRVGIVAVIGWRGRPVEPAALSFALHSFKHEDDPAALEDLAVLALFGLYAGDGSILRWPAVEGAGLSDDKRRDRRIETDIHPHTLGKDVLGLPPGVTPASPRFHRALEERLDLYETASMEGRQQAYFIAKWGVPPLEYGPTSEDAITAAKGQAVELFEVVRACNLQNQPLEIASLLQEQIDSARAAGDRKSLAAWRALFTYGSELLSQGIHMLQQEAIQDLAGWAAAPAQLRSALREGSGLYSLLYASRPEFGGDYFRWRCETDDAVELGTPRLVGTARALVGPVWWAGLVKAFARQDQDAIDRHFVRFSQLVALLAEWRILQRPEFRPTVGDGTHVSLDQFGPGLPHRELEQPVDEVPEGRTFEGRALNVRERMQMVLGDRRWEILRMVELEGKSQRDVAGLLRLSTGRVSQLLKEAKDRLTQDPNLRALFQQDDD